MKEQTQYKLEYKLLYSLVVAGKSAKFAEAVMAKFLSEYDWKSPFACVEHLINHGSLLTWLKHCKSGNYTKLERAFKAIVEANLDLKVCTPQQLEEIPGIGPKTSRFFILWTRPGAQFAALDVHVLKWLKYKLHEWANVPRTTPSGNLYAVLEAHFLMYAKDMKMTPGELDEKIWRWCEQNNNKGLDYMQKDSWPKKLQ